MSDASYQSVTREFSGAFVSLDVEKLKANLQDIVARKEELFSYPPDAITWERLTKDGKLSGEAKPDELALILDACDNSTEQVRLRLFKEKRTRNVGLILQPDEFLYVTVDFIRKTFFFSAHVATEVRCYELFELVTADISLIAAALPPEHQYLEPFLRKFYQDHPVFERNIFLIMRFQDQLPFPELVAIIRDECAKRNLNVLRADDKEYTDDLWDNVMTYLYGCSAAIALFDHINYRDFNPNVALEVGFLLAQRKRVLLLKDQAIPVMPTDLIGRIYRSFNTYAPRETIPSQITKWLTDYKMGQ